MWARFNSLEACPSLRRASPIGRLANRPVATRLRYGMGAAAFWSGIALPLVYLPLLAQGIETVSGLGLVLGLIELHLAALIIGRNHGRE